MSTARRPGTSRAPAAPGTPTEASRWTADQIRALGVATDLRTAAHIFGLSSNTAYELVRRGRFPVPVIRAGRQYRVSVAAILAVLDTPAQPSPQPPPDTGA
jgi:predicted DNA-binding transcriptional regulator AlpA